MANTRSGAWKETTLRALAPHGRKLNRKTKTRLGTVILSPRTALYNFFLEPWLDAMLSCAFDFAVYVNCRRVGGDAGRRGAVHVAVLARCVRLCAPQQP